MRTRGGVLAASSARSINQSGCGYEPTTVVGNSLSCMDTTKLRRHDSIPSLQTAHGAKGLPGELRVQAHDARVHVRQRSLPDGYTRNERRVVEQRGVAVRHVVDVEPRRETSAAEADDLLQAQIDRSVAVAVQRAPAV